MSLRCLRLLGTLRQGCRWEKCSIFHYDREEEKANIKI